MIINKACSFNYANKYSDTYNVVLSNVDGINEETVDEVTELLLSTTPFKNTWDFHGLNKTEPFSFKLTLVKKDNSYFDSYDVRNIKKWLCKNSYNWLQIEQDDILDFYYYCVIHNPMAVNVGRYTAALTFDVVCNAQNAWSDEKVKHYSSTTSSTSLLYIESDYDDYVLYPIIKFTCNSNGNITLKNNTTGKVVTFNSCTNGEIITLDCRNYKIKSSKNRIMLDYWNKNVFGLIDGENSISLEGNYNLEMNYRLPIRVSG